MSDTSLYVLMFAGVVICGAFRYVAGNLDYLNGRITRLEKLLEARHLKTKADDTSVEWDL
jgi:hypothetical protein